MLIPILDHRSWCNVFGSNRRSASSPIRCRLEYGRNPRYSRKQINGTIHSSGLGIFLIRFTWPLRIKSKRGVAIQFGCLNKRTSRRMTALSSETDILMFLAHTCQPLGSLHEKCMCQRNAQYSFDSTHALQPYGFQLGGPHQLLGAHCLVQVAPLHCLQKRRHSFPQ